VEFGGDVADGAGWNLPFAREIQNQAAKGNLQAERRAGVLLIDVVPHGGNHKKGRDNGTATLAELGINSNQSARWRREAAVPEDVFEHYIAEANQKGNEITSAGLLRVARAVDGKNRNSRAGKRPASSTFDGAFTCMNNGDAKSGSHHIILEFRQLFEDLKGHRNLLEEVWAGGKGKSLDTGQQRLVTRVLAEMRRFIDSLEQSVFGELSPAKC
jgi:hypothetical protein